jgi:uncharacterized protein (DUF433 family)
MEVSSMTLTVGTEQIPIRIDQDGIARVGGTRVTLDTVIDAYEREHSVERIVRQYDALTLADVHYVIGYYLSHQAEVSSYLAYLRSVPRFHLELLLKTFC